MARHKYVNTAAAALRIYIFMYIHTGMKTFSPDGKIFHFYENVFISQNQLPIKDIMLSSKNLKIRDVNAFISNVNVFILTENAFIKLTSYKVYYVK